MNTENRYTFLKAIYDELEKAEKKHPKFCDDLTNYTKTGCKAAEKLCKKINSSAPYFADELLREELFEAFVSYKEGDKEHCLQELAQCGAVILRMMEFVKNEMEA